MAFCQQCENKPLGERVIIGGAMICDCTPSGDRPCVGDGTRSNTAKKVCDECSQHYGVCQECGEDF